MQKVTLIDYGSGNLRSAAKAFERVNLENNLNKSISISSKITEIKKSDYIILPGVGAYKDCKQGLDKIEGLEESLKELVFEKKRPFLGICVGMQLLSDIGVEYGSHEGLGWISGKVLEIKPKDKSLKIPHMGWNEINIENKSHPVLSKLKDKSHAYFVHSFHFEARNKQNVLATVDYGSKLTAIIGKDNILGTQFHPEKSQKTGLDFIKAFLTWKP